MHNDRKGVVRLFAALLLVLVVRLGYVSPAIASIRNEHHHVHHQRQKVIRAAGWAGAGLAAGRFAGPGGSATVGIVKHRKDLKAGGHRRVRAIRKIGVPIAVGVVAGPIGSGAYAAVEHRKWIKHHILHRKSR
jgi:hypothetical protein